MADNAIDTRIVEAKFDASDFKKGVDQTIKKLDELKEKLQLKDTEKSITEVSQKTQEATEKTSKSLDKLTDRLTTFTGMIKQQLLSGFAEKVSGVFFRIESSITSLVRSMSTQQISVGMRKYEQMLTSVRIMMSAGKSQSESYAAIEKLAEYSDQTSYSLDQMTDAMSKMVAAGVDLDVAAKSVEGISNACANAGINATDASRAFYNLSQAYSSGSLKYTDYRSLELLNMTTKEFKQQMLDAAVAAGTLKKSTKGIYTTTNKKNKKVTSGKKVTIESLSDSLRYGFMDKEAMNQLFGTEYFFDEQALDKIYDEHNLRRGSEADRKKAFEIAEEEYGKVAVSAYKAAKEARSFTDVMNTFKDVISTGWSKSFELLIGKLEDATEFFTWLTENNLAEAIYSIGEYRNTILEVFGAGRTDSILGIYGNSGRDNIILGLKEIDEIFGKILEQFTGLIPSATELGLKLRRLSRDFLNATRNMSAWLDSRETKDGPTRLERIGEVVKSVATIISDFGAIIKSVFGVAGSLISNTFKYIFGIGDEVDGVSKKGFDGATRVGKAFGEFKNILDSVHQTLKPVVEFLQKILDIAGKVAQFFINMAVDTFLMNLEWIADIIGLIVELLGGTSGQKINEGVGVIEGLNNSINELGKACTDAWMAIHDFFNSLIKDFKNLLGVNKEGETTGESSGPFSSLISYFQNNEYFAAVKEWILKAFQDVKNFILDIPNKIGKFTETIKNVWNSLLWEEKSFWDIDEKGNKKRYTVKVRTQFGKLVDDIVNEVKAFVISIPTRVKDFFHNIPNMWNSLLWDEKTLWDVDEKGKKKKYTIKVRTAFGKVIDSVVKAIVKFIRMIPTYIRKAIKGVGSIFRSIVNVLLGRDTNTDGQKKASEEAKSGIAKFFEDIFKDFSLSKVISYITDIGKTILNEIASIFTGTDDVETNQEWFANAIANGITWIKTKAVEAWDNIKKWFINLPTTIANVFKFDGKDGEASPIVTAITDFANTIGVKIGEIPGTIKSFVDTASDELEKIWGSLYETITGKKSIFSDSYIDDPMLLDKFDQIEKSYGKLAGKEWQGSSNPLLDKMLSVADDKKWKKRTLGDEIVEVLSKAASDVKTKLLDFVNNTLGPWFKSAWDEIGKLWDKLYNWLRGKIVGDDGAVADREKIDPSEAINDAAPTEAFDGKDGPWQTFINSVKTFFTTAFQDIGTWITQAIDLGLSGMKKGVENLGNILNTVDLSNVFGWGNDKTSEIQNGKDPEAFEALEKEALSFDEIIKKITEGMSEEDASTLSPLLSAVLNLGHTIYEIITTTIPEFIKNAWEFISRNATSAWDYLSKTVLGWINDTSGRSGTDKEFQNFGEVVQHVIHRMTIYITSAWWWVKRNAKKGWNYVKDLFTSWVKDEGARNGSKTEINNFGDAVKVLITEIIPTKIAEAYEDIKTKVVNIWTSLGGIFEEWAALNEEENPVKKKVGEIGSAIYKFVTEIIPAKIREAIDYVKRLLGIKKGPLEEIAASIPNAKTISDAFKKANVSRFMRDRPVFSDAAEDATAAPDEAPEDTGILGWINDVIAAIGEALKNLGPIILEGINAALGFLNKIGTIIADALTGNKSVSDAVEDNAPKEESKIKESLIRIGENLKTFFIETLPKLIGSAIAAIIEFAPQWFDNLFEGILGKGEEVSKDLPDKKEANTVAGKIVDNTVGIFETLLDSLQHLNMGDLSNVGTIAVTMIAVMEIVKLITSFFDTINIPGNVAKAKEASTSLGAVIKWLVAAFVAMMAFAVYVSTLDDAQFEKVKTVLGFLTTFLDILTIAYGAISMTEDITDTIQGGQDSHSNPERLEGSLNDQVSRIDKIKDIGVNFLGNIADSLGGFAKTAGKTFGISFAGMSLSSAGSSILENIFGDLTTFGSTLTGLVEEIKVSVGMLVEIKEDVDTAVEVMGKVVDITAKLPDIAKNKDFSNDASEALTGFTGGLANFVTAVKGKNIRAKEVVESLGSLIDMKDKMGEFAEWANEGSTFSDFKYAIASLGSALNLYTGNSGNLQNIEEGYVSKMISVVSELIGNDELAGLAQALAGSEFPTPSETYKNMESAVIFTGILKQLADAATGITEQDGTNIGALFSAIKSINMDSIEDSDGKITTFADTMGQLGVALGTFATNTKGIKMEDVETSEYALTVLAGIANSIKTTGQSWLDKLFSGTANLGTFATGIRSLGIALRDFMDAIEGRDIAATADDEKKMTEGVERDKELIMIAGMLVQDLGYAAAQLKTTTTSGNFDSTTMTDIINTLPVLTENIKTFLLSLQKPETWDENGGFNKDSFDFIGTVIGVMERIIPIMTQISELDDIQKKMNEVAGAMVTHEAGFYGTQVGFFDLITTTLTNFGGFYHSLKNGGAFGFTEDDVKDFYSLISGLFKSMGYMFQLVDIGQSITDVSHNLAGTTTININTQGYYEGIIEALQYFNEHDDIIKTFLENAQQYSSDGAIKATHFFTAMSDLANAMTLFADMARINQGMRNLQSFKWSTVSTILNSMIDCFNEEILNKDKQTGLHEVGAEIARLIYDGINAAYSEDDTLSPVITPVIDLKNVEAAKDRIRALLGLQDDVTYDMSEVTNGARSANPDNAVDEEAIDYTDDIRDVKIEIAGLASHIDGVAEKIGSMSVSIDKGKLVGEIIDPIDFLLGKRHYSARREKG